MAKDKKIMVSEGKGASAGKGVAMGRGVRIAGMTKTRAGEVWRLLSEGKVVNLTASNSSTAIMDEAVIIYSPALERLAKR
jgi:hypothetical protein